MIEQLITIAGTAGAVLAVVLPLQLRTVARLDRIESRLSDLEARVGRLETRMDALDARMDAIEARMDRIEARMDRIEARFDSFTSGFGKVAQRVARIEGILISSREASEAAVQ